MRNLRIPFPDKQKVVAHADAFRLFADVKMIAQILLIASPIHVVDQVLQQFTDAIGSHLMSDPHASLPQKLPAPVHCVKDKGIILQLERLLIIGSLQKIIRVLLLHG